MAKMFVNYSKTKAEFIAAGLATTYNNSIVFIKGDAQGNGSCIYTHGQYFANFSEFINAINYVKGVNVDGKNYNAAVGGGYIAFNASDPSTVAVNAGANGINIGLTTEFVNKVNNTVTNLGATGDSANASGSAFARIANLANLVADLKGNGDGSISDQITDAVNALRTEIVGTLGTDDSKTLAAINDELDSIISNYNTLKGRVDTIEGVVLSHLHSDHIGGLLTVLENFSVKSIYLSDVCDREDPLYLEIISATDRKETKVVYLKKNDKIVMGTATFTVLWTPQSANENNASLVLGAECDELTFFFGGDISSTEERKMLDNNVISRFNILKASHHGSKNSGCDEFLDAVSPQYCVCFCGKDNDYSFPNEEFVNRIKKRGIVMYTTAENGDIVFNTKDKTVSLEKTKAAHQ